MQAGTGKIEEELKALSSAYQEKQQAVQSGKRKKGGSLITAPLEEVLTEEHVKVGRGWRDGWMEGWMDGHLRPRRR